MRGDQLFGRAVNHSRGGTALASVSYVEKIPRLSFPITDTRTDTRLGHICRVNPYTYEGNMTLSLGVRNPQGCW